MTYFVITNITVSVILVLAGLASVFQRRVFIEKRTLPNFDNKPSSSLFLFDTMDAVKIPPKKLTDKELKAYFVRTIVELETSYKTNHAHQVKSVIENNERFYKGDYFRHHDSRMEAHYWESSFKTLADKPTTPEYDKMLDVILTKIRKLQKDGLF